MHIITGIIRVAIALAAFAFATNSLSQYFGGNEADVAKYTQLANEGETVVALLDSMYTETSVGSVSIYNIDYQYSVDGVDYKGNMNIDDPDALVSPFVEITYLPSDPSVSSADVPKALLKAQESSESKSDLWLGLAAVVFGGFMLWSGISAFRSGGSEAADA
ncbi:MAG: hypothetical protein AAF597_00035 [Bacteroidota bacterium]